MMKQGFTLTMWDVKRVEVIIKEVGERGFTLTMWDVKEDEAWDAAAEVRVLP